MVKPPGVFPERFVRAVGEGEQAGAPLLADLNGGATNCVDVVGVGWELHL